MTIPYGTGRTLFAKQVDFDCALIFTFIHLRQSWPSPVIGGKSVKFELANFGYELYRITTVVTYDIVRRLLVCLLVPEENMGSVSLKLTSHPELMNMALDFQF